MKIRCLRNFADKTWSVISFLRKFNSNFPTGCMKLRSFNWLYSATCVTFVQYCNWELMWGDSDEWNSGEVVFFPRWHCVTSRYRNCLMQERVVLCFMWLTMMSLLSKLCSTKKQTFYRSYYQDTIWYGTKILFSILYVLGETFVILSLSLLLLLFLLFVLSLSLVLFFGFRFGFQVCTSNSVVFVVVVVVVFVYRGKK